MLHGSPSAKSEGWLRNAIVAYARRIAQPPARCWNDTVPRHEKKSVEIAAPLPVHSHFFNHAATLMSITNPS
jgi:hypothetical protein